MVTKVGLQENFVSALQDLMELDYDAIEAYDVAINRIENADFKTALANFKNDHEKHVREITHLLQQHNEDVPTGPSAKQWLTKGKVVLANLIGDNAILSAMHSNEIDTNTAYERLNQHKSKWPESSDFLERGLQDEKRHKAWLETTLKRQENT